MADLSVSWLGLQLRNPVVLSASPVSDDTALVKEFVRNGVAAVVMRSVFEEQIIADQMGAHHYLDSHTDQNAEAGTFHPDSDVFALGIETYANQLRKLRAAVDVPVIASLNGTSDGGWADYSRTLEQAGASAIELNLYDLPTSVTETALDVEERQLAVVRHVVSAVSIPVNVKLSPFYTSIPAFILNLELAGVRGISLFNRFYQSDVDLETLEVERVLTLSTRAELPLRLNTLAVLQPHVTVDMACTGGVHSGLDVAKSIACGAKVTQIASAFLDHGPSRAAQIIEELNQWLDGKRYKSVQELKGVMGLENCPDPHAWLRLNYIKILDGWIPKTGSTGRN